MILTSVFRLPIQSQEICFVVGGAVTDESQTLPTVLVILRINCRQVPDTRCTDPSFVKGIRSVVRSHLLVNRLKPLVAGPVRIAFEHDGGHLVPLAKLSTVKFHPQSFRLWIFGLQTEVLWL